MTVFDYIVIGFYLVFMLALGPVYKSFSKTASDYFRGGGGMLWWVVGASAFMTTFSAWSFTGGAAKAYETGTFFLLLFLSNFIGLFVTYFVTAKRYRQMRIITAIEAVRKRYCNTNEQFFTWAPLITKILFGGVSLYAIGVFMFGVFGRDLQEQFVHSESNDNSTYVAADRPGKGQTFKTGDNKDGYRLRTFSFQHLNWPEKIEPGTRYDVQSGDTFSFQFGKMEDDKKQPLLTGEAEYAGETMAGVDDTGTGNYLTFNFAGAGLPVLEPEASYYFEIASGTGEPYLELNSRGGVSAYRDGTAYLADGSQTVAKESVLAGDFVFHADLLTNNPANVSTAPAKGATGDVPKVVSVTASLVAPAGDAASCSHLHSEIKEVATIDASDGLMVMRLIIIALGITAIVMTLLGGSWAATAGDFVQMVMLLAITVLMAILCLWHPEVGGPAELVEKLPSKHFNWTEFDRPWVIGFFFVFLLINQTMQNNSMLEGAAKYVFVKDGRDAKKSVMVSIVGFLLLSPIWLIPAVTATIIYPDLGQVYPDLNNPSEGAYVAMAINLLPAGLLGLMVCAIFAASMTSLNSGLNVVSGTFVRNFYIRVIDKTASESRQILVGRLFTLCYGILWIVVGLVFAPLKGLKLFDLIMIVAGAVGLPAAIPLFLGMFIKRTPKWSAWTTMLIGFSTSLVMTYLCRTPELTRELISGIFNPEIAFNGQEIADLKIGLTYAVIGGLCVGWYFLTMLFYKKEDTAYVKQVDEFFEEMNTPVNTEEEHGPTYDNDARQYNVLGTLCLIYGSFVLLLMLVPNSMKDRLLILLVGGIIAVTGAILKMIAKRVRLKIEHGERAPV